MLRHRTNMHVILFHTIFFSLQSTHWFWWSYRGIPATSSSTPHAPAQDGRTHGTVMWLGWVSQSSHEMDGGCNLLYHIAMCILKQLFVCPAVWKKWLNEMTKGGRVAATAAPASDDNSTTKAGWWSASRWYDDSPQPSSSSSSSFVNLAALMGVGFSDGWCLAVEVGGTKIEMQAIII